MTAETTASSPAPESIDTALSTGARALLEQNWAERAAQKAASDRLMLSFLAPRRADDDVDCTFAPGCRCGCGRSGRGGGAR